MTALGPGRNSKAGQRQRRSGCQLLAELRLTSSLMGHSFQRPGSPRARSPLQGKKKGSKELAQKYFALKASSSQGPHTLSLRKSSREAVFFHDMAKDGDGKGGGRLV